jgi:hypothetical protein
VELESVTQRSVSGKGEEPCGEDRTLLSFAEGLKPPETDAVTEESSSLTPGLGLIRGNRGLGGKFGLSAGEEDEDEETLEPVEGGVMERCSLPDSLSDSTSLSTSRGWEESRRLGGAVGLEVASGVDKGVAGRWC